MDLYSVLEILHKPENLHLFINIRLKLNLG